MLIKYIAALVKNATLFKNKNRKINKIIAARIINKWKVIKRVGRSKQRKIDKSRRNRKTNIRKMLKNNRVIKKNNKNKLIYK